MTRKISVFLIMLAICTSLFSQESVNYSPKSLQRELKKFNPADVATVEMTFLSQTDAAVRNGKYFRILAPFSKIKYIYIGRVFACRFGGCSIKPLVVDENEREFFDYYLFFDALAVVQHVKVFNYQALHGEEITSTNWLKQFRNYDGKSELVLGKNVDAIAGATVSADAISVDIEYVTNKLREIIR